MHMIGKGKAYMELLARIIQFVFPLNSQLSFVPTSEVHLHSYSIHTYIISCMHSVFSDARMLAHNPFLHDVCMCIGKATNPTEGRRK